MRPSDADDVAVAVAVAVADLLCSALPWSIAGAGLLCCSVGAEC